MLEASGTIGRRLKIAAGYLIPRVRALDRMGNFHKKMWTTNIDLRNRMWCSWMGGMRQGCQSPTAPPRFLVARRDVNLFLFLHSFGNFLRCSESGVKCLCSVVNLFIEGIKSIWMSPINCFSWRTKFLSIEVYRDFVKIISFNRGCVFTLVILWV